jgi:repressor LexA
MPSVGGHLSWSRPEKGSLGMINLTEKQQSILDFIEGFMGRQGMSPTMYEVAEFFRIKPATAFAHLRALQRKGFVDRSTKARSLTLTKTRKPKHLSLSLSIPILGRISAGLPLLAESNVEGQFQMDPGLLPRGTGGHALFGLRVKGDSMIDAGILEDDLLVVKQTETARIGDIVVALVEDEATVKYLHLGEKTIELRPANKKYKVQRYPYDQVKIQGVVVALHRSM